VHAEIDLGKPLGVGLSRDAVVKRVAPPPPPTKESSSFILDPKHKLKKRSSNSRGNKKRGGSDDDDDDGGDENKGGDPRDEEDEEEEEPPPESGAQGGLRVGCRLVAVGDVSVKSRAEVEQALSRWRFEGMGTCPITFTEAAQGAQLERQLLAVMAAGQESRVAVDAGEARFLPSLWTDPGTSGFCPGRDFSTFQARLPTLLGLRPAGSSLLDKKWEIKSSTVAFGLQVK
jgi:hypothetical protein